MNMAAELAPDRVPRRLRAAGPGRGPSSTPRSPTPRRGCARLEKLVPLGRVGQPDEIARWIGHLADPGADWVTGTVLTVDGGRVLGPPGA